MGEQLGLFQEEEKLKWVMLSLQPQYYQELCQGIKKTEYRRGAFVREPVQGFVYCSAPQMEIGAYVKLGKPVSGKPELIAAIKEKELPGSYEMMLEWMKGFTEASALPVEEVRVFPPISLREMKGKFPRFQPPQRFMYLDKYPEILSFLKQTSGLF